MNKHEVFHAIIDFEHEVGESFLDRFGYNINAANFMFWARGKNYINVEQFQEWEHAFSNGELEADDPNYYVYIDDEDVTFALIIDEEREEETYHAAIRIVAEFLSESSIYTRRLEAFIDDKES